MKEKEIDYGSEKISVLFKKLFFPTVMGMLSISAVTTIDGIFVGHGVGSDGIAAVNICIPLLMILMGIGLMAGTGCSVVAAIHLSQGKKVAARTNTTHAMLFVTILALTAISVIVAFPQQTALALGSSEHLLPMVVDYLVWFAPSLLFELWVTVALFAIRLDGAPRFAMWCSIITAFANTILDWLFIFPLGWGIRGAALATSVSCLIGAAAAVSYLAFYARTVRLYPLRPTTTKTIGHFLRNMRTQCKIGASALLGEMTMAILFFVGNHVFMNYLGDNGVGAFGVSCYYLPFIFMIGNAITQSAQPIISYNYGIGDDQRVRSALLASFTAAFVCGLCASAAFILLPELLVGLFLRADTPTALIAITGFPYYGIGFVFFVLNLAVIGYYQSIERVKPAVIFALLRGAVFLIPCFLLLPQTIGIKGIWLALPLSEILTTSTILIVFACRFHQRDTR